MFITAHCRPPLMRRPEAGNRPLGHYYYYYPPREGGFEFHRVGLDTRPRAVARKRRFYSTNAYRLNVARPSKIRASNRLANDRRGALRPIVHTTDRPARRRFLTLTLSGRVERSTEFLSRPRRRGFTRYVVNLTRSRDADTPDTCPDHHGRRRRRRQPPDAEDPS